VTLTVTSVADNTKSVQVTFTIVTNNPNNAKLNGHYVFTFSGFDNNGNAVVRGGVFIADENGNIAGGVQDSNNAATGPSKNQTISGTYNVASDNRGTMTLGGVGYRFALGSIVSGVATRGHFVEFDINTSTGVGIEGSGEFKLQDATLIPFSLTEIASDFAFGASGTDSAGKRFGVAARVTIGSTGTVSNGAIDIGSPGSNANLGSFSDPNNTLGSFGRLLAALTPAGQNVENFAFYIVSSTELFFLDVDDTSNKTAMFTGVAEKQIIPSSGFTNASANGNAIFNVTGADADVAGGANVTIGQVTADGQGNLSGILDQNEGGTISTGIPFTGKYSIASNGRGTLTFVINPTTSRPFTFYVADTNAVFLLEGTPATPGSDVQQGFVEPQATGPFDDSTIAGKWAGSTGAPPAPSVRNSSGAFTFDGTLDAFSGTIDETLFSSPFEIPDEAITGSYATTAVGRASVTLTSGGGGNGVIWIVSANRFVLLLSTNCTRPHD